MTLVIHPIGRCNSGRYRWGLGCHGCRTHRPLLTRTALRSLTQSNRYRCFCTLAIEYCQLYYLLYGLIALKRYE